MRNFTRNPPYASLIGMPSQPQFKITTWMLIDEIPQIFIQHVSFDFKNQTLHLERLNWSYKSKNVSENPEGMTSAHFYTRLIPLLKNIKTSNRITKGMILPFTKISVHKIWNIFNYCDVLLTGRKIFYCVRVPLFKESILKASSEGDTLFSFPNY